MKLSTALLASLFIFLSLMATTQAADKLRCATTGSFPPFSFMEGEMLVGIDVDQVKLAARRLNINMDIVAMPFSRMLVQMKEGELDCMFAAYKTPEREIYMDFTSVPNHVSSLMFFQRRDSNTKYNSIDDLKGLTIGLVRGHKVSEDFDAALDNGWFTVEKVNEHEQNFRKLSFGRLDLVLVNRHVGGYILKKTNIANIQTLPVALTKQPAYLTFSKKRHHTRLIPLFDAELQKAINNGTFKKIVGKYIAE